MVYVKDDMWIVKENFRSDSTHDYKQVWQGHYTHENGPNLIRSSFDDASGCDILQLNPVNGATISGARGKNWTVVSQNDKLNSSFVTIIYPYRGCKRIDEIGLDKIGDWVINSDEWKVKGFGPKSISQSNEGYFFGVNEDKKGNITINTAQPTDLLVQISDDKVSIHLLSENEALVTLMQGDAQKEKKVLMPGGKVSITID